MEHVRFFRFLFGGFAATRFVGHAFPDKNHQRLFDIPNVQAAFVFPIQIHLLVKRQQAGGEIQLFMFGEIRAFFQVQNQAFLAVAVRVKIFVGIVEQDGFGVFFAQGILFARHRLP
nr:hypothetical protein [Cardiobacterium valvarum]